VIDTITRFKRFFAFGVDGNLGLTQKPHAPPKSSNNHPEKIGIYISCLKKSKNISLDINKALHYNV